MILNFRRKARIETIEAQDDAAVVRDYSAAIRQLAQSAASMGKEAAELHGVLDDVNQVAMRQSESFKALSAEVQQMVHSNRGIAGSVEATQVSALQARGAVERVAHDVSSAAETLREVAQAAAEITQIALQTRLVAFNASVEAKRAGEAGRGFSVVADAVRELAQEVESSSKHIASTVQQLDARIGELERNIRSTEPRHGVQTFNSAFSHVEAAVAAIATAAQDNVRACGGTLASVERLAAEVISSTGAIDRAKSRAESFLKTSERLIELGADCGAETDDTPFIRHVMQMAAEVSSLFESALDAGTIDAAALFDDRYVPVAGTSPQQVMTRFTSFTDHVLPPIQEAALAFSDKVVFCAAVDRNGYLPTHNLKFSRTQTHDPVWNAAHCRNRRIFNDRTGLAAARNTNKFLLQTYRRDMGGGNFVLMKDLSAPIIVHGRHWGGLRFAYKF